ncbi:hypothetical protein [Sphingomonas sp. S2-65]|uniref:hypothetical protein n=1 Tax=Sphingomonas sp. S2-65 TaxID=2903960 RepID=UPI001F18CC95|nr:hypothetical protein [Sphingomonas sp. S2-65]UYY60098.1 hypothetical protein LZ586_08480 [Sphingomonas sp. S2-65]
MSVGSQLTAKKPTAQATGSQTQFAADPDAGIPLVLGRTGTAGNIVMRKGFNTKDDGDNDRQSFVSVLSLGPVKSVGSFKAEKVPVNFNATGGAIGAFAGFMWAMTQIGALPEPAALGFGAGAGSPPGWTAAHKLSGKAAASWTLRFDTKAKLYQNGVPEPMWVVEGMLCYDPRKDSTYPGGSGPHRMADPSDRAAYDAAVSTWEYSENPYLWGLKWAHGIWQRDKTNPNSDWVRVMGMGAPQAGIDVASFVEGANIADANGWKVGGVVFSGDDKWDSLKKILQAGMGEPLALGAKVACFVNAPRVSLATITTDDVVGEASVAATQPRRSRINTITPRYRLEANHWELLPGPPISVPEHVAEDRGRRSKVQDYPFIQNSKQVATAVRYDIENAREFGPIKLPLKLVWMGYKPGDCVTAQLPELGLVNQPILLLNRDLEPAGGIVTMTARSETAAKHPFALGQTTTPPPTPGVTGPVLIPVPGEGAWMISGTGIVSGEATVPALIVTGAMDAASPDAIVLEYRVFASGQAEEAGWRGAGVFGPDMTRQDISSVQGGTAYEVAVSYRRQGFTGQRRIIGPVTTSGTTLDFGAVTGPTRPEDGATVGAPTGTIIHDRVAEEIVDSLDINTAGILAEALRQDDLLAVFDARTLVEGQAVGTQFLTFRNAQQTATTALAASLSLMGAKTPDGTAWNMNLDKVMAGPVTMAQKFSEIGATLGTVSASVTVLQDAFVSEAGATAKSILRADADGITGAFSITADGITRKSRIAFMANEFDFVDPNGDNPIRPLFYANGRWTFGEIYATRIVADIVETRHLKAASAQQTRFVVLPGDVSCPRGVTTTVATLTFTKAEPDSTVKAQFFGMFWSPDDLQFAGAFVVNGNTGYAAGSVNIILDTENSQGRMPMTPFIYLQGLGAGQHTIAFTVLNTETENLALTVKAGSALEVLELKKAVL